MRGRYDQLRRFLDALLSGPTFAVVEKDFSVQNVVALLRGAPYTAVVDGKRFLGLITRADVLNHMRKQIA